MSQSLAQNYMHLVFSTKHRYPFIDDAISTPLFEYLGGICNGLDCQPLIVGGYRDHVHILCMLSKKLALMDLLQKVKRSSSLWIKTQGNAYQNFYWQDGYAGYSVSHQGIPGVTQYVAGQREHHRHSPKENFQDESRRLLREHEMVWDERYFWD